MNSFLFIALVCSFIVDANSFSYFNVHLTQRNGILRGKLFITDKLALTASNGRKRSTAIFLSDSSEGPQEVVDVPADEGNAEEPKIEGEADPGSSPENDKFVQAVKDAEKKLQDQLNVYHSLLTRFHGILTYNTYFITLILSLYRTWKALYDQSGLC